MPWMIHDRLWIRRESSTAAFDTRESTMTAWTNFSLLHHWIPFFPDSL